MGDYSFYNVISLCVFLLVFFVFILEDVLGFSKEMIEIVVLEFWLEKLCEGGVWYNLVFFLKIYVLFVVYYVFCVGEGIVEELDEFE